jgi:hypothetical protein
MEREGEDGVRRWKGERTYQYSWRASLLLIQRCNEKSVVGDDGAVGAGRGKKTEIITF